MENPLRPACLLQALALFAVTGAAAQTAPATSPWPHAELEGRKPVTIAGGPVSVTLRLVKARGGEAPVATVKVDGRQVIELGVGKGASATIGAHARILSLDGTTARPQVVFSRFTGGAHCCAHTFIATQAGGKWRSIDAGRHDGEEGYEFKDIDGDGGVELVGVDNRFLYRFDSYAGSLAPTRIYRLSGTKLVDVTREARFQAFLRAVIAKHEKEADENPESWKTNGFLAGWVAMKALVGEQADAWPRMLKQYDRENTWGVPECDREEEKKARDCKDPAKMALKFPAALRAFLVANNYLQANDPATR